MAETALEVAIALWRMPSMRTALRERPLPEGVGEVIELAAGNPERVARAAERLQEPPSEVLEAARFYVREVLLAADGDAYRTLGLAPGAHGADIKAHHRALQHWLHPDRRGDDWDSAFATRINNAWSLLRTPERRASYDARQAASPDALAEAPGRRLVTGWRAAPEAHPSWGRLVLPVLALLALLACVWLLVLAGRQASAPPPEWDAGPVRAERARVAAPRPPLPPAVPSVGATAVATPSGPEAGDTAADARVATAVAPTQAATGPGVATAVAPTQAATGPGMATAVAPTPATTDPGVPTSVAPTAAGPGAEKPTLATIDWAAERTPEAAPTPAEGPPLARIHLAHATGQEITGYLRGDATLPPPVWSTVAALDSADAVRSQLAMGHVPRFGQPQWRIGADRATMTARVQGAAVGSPHVVRVELSWRDEMWLVDALHAEIRQ